MWAEKVSSKLINGLPPTFYPVTFFELVDASAPFPPTLHQFAATGFLDLAVIENHRLSDYLARDFGATCDRVYIKDQPSLGVSERQGRAPFGQVSAYRFTFVVAEVTR